MLLKLDINQNGYAFAANLDEVLADAESDLSSILSKIDENTHTINKMTADCDNIDYILSVCSGVLCGVIDIFLIGKPGDSPVGNITDKWFEDRTVAFAKMCGWNGTKNSSTSSAIKYLEKKFKIPYDQTGAGDAASWVFDLNPKNHHFKSLGHNPTLLGLFFSILDQFANTSHFVTDGELISLQESDGKWVLRGNNIPSKIFCGFINWFGHIVSDISGSSSSKGRGMGIPSPFWAWTNDIIAIKKKANIPVTEFDKSINELALEIFKKGYDIRFQVAQTIPVLINEMLVRTIYSIRRMVRYFNTVEKKIRSFSLLWETCEPFTNATVKRMLTVAHGTFCLVDASDVLVRGIIYGGGSLNIAESIMRLNIIGIGRFTISLYGEVTRRTQRTSLKEEAIVLKREKLILTDYVEGLQYLSKIYDDNELLQFTKDLQGSEMYIKAFEKTITLAEKRKVPEDKILKNKTEIDFYFNGGKS
ncbi:MAG: hypothetical protein E7I91_06865 [Streptococcus mitis]|nr:hypothetical protein [Streptococcus mitis]